ncbi:hypothetical protein GCM10009828_067660 [Actinoplanes couchii]
MIATDVLAADGVRPLDVRSLDQWTALARFLEETYGRVDAVINNAGVTGRDRLPDIDLDTWETTLAINLTGPMLSMKTLVPLMPRGFGTVGPFAKRSWVLVCFRGSCSSGSGCRVCRGASGHVAALGRRRPGGCGVGRPGAPVRHQGFGRVFGCPARFWSAA